MALIGELSLHYEGYGFVVSPKPGQADVFVPARFLQDCLPGDTVEVEVRPGRRGLLEGKVVRIVKRGLSRIVGRLEQHGEKWVLLSEDQRVRHRMLLKTAPLHDCRSGDYVVAAITQYPHAEKPLQGEVVQKLPPRGGLRAEIEYVIAKHQLPQTFPPAVLHSAKQAEGRRETIKEEGAHRRDLRSLPFVTIDGEDAKDFDDAVCAQALGPERWKIWVAIADVSHYVAARSALDEEALARATSVYFPGRVLPMLPEALSNDLCSLKPNEDRLALVAEWELDTGGGIFKEQFYPAVFQSQARLTYQIVKKILEDRDPAERAQYAALVPMLETLSAAAGVLKAGRSRRGSLDFDLPEPEIVLDFTGGISDIEKAERFWSHQIIEELMIAANEAVARFLTERKTGCLYRVHEGPDPEKIRSFYKLVQRLGYKGHFPKGFSGKGLQHILAFFKGHSEERLVNTMLLRSMAQAVYSERNLGHFGLSSRCYCHFTSPIRRYPDLIVHRLLKSALREDGSSKQGGEKWKAGLASIAEQSSLMERKAMAAEREMLSLHQTLFMQDKKGNIFEGVISHVTRFGFFVELLEYFVEGLVLKGDLPGSTTFDESHLTLRSSGHKGSKGRSFKIGDRGRIQVQEIQVPERRVTFKWLD